MPRENGYFSTANAKDMAARSVELRKNKRILAVAHEDFAPLTTDESFRLKVLTQVRERIESVLEILFKEKDASELDKLTRSLRALADVEQRLCGRPNPGSLKPSAAKPRQSHAEPEPVIELTPAPTVEDASDPGI